MTPDGKRIVTGRDQPEPYTIEVWDAHSLRKLASFGAQRCCCPARLTPDGKNIVVGWGGNDGKYVLRYDVDSHKLLSKFLYGSPEYALSPGGKTIAVGREDALDVRTLATGKLVRRLRRWLANPAASMAASPTYSPDGRHIAFVDALEWSEIDYANGGRDQIGIFSLGTGRRLRTIGWPHTCIWSATYAPNGKYMAVVAETDRWGASRKADPLVVYKILLLDPQTGALVRYWTTKEQIDALALAPNSRWLAYADETGTVQVRDLTKCGALCYDARTDTSPVPDVRSLCFSPDSRTLLVGGEYVWLIPIHG